MAGNEQLGRRGIERGADRRVVVAGIAPNMLDQHVNILTLEAVEFAVHQPQVATVAVAADGTERAERCQPFCHLNGADVARMPYLIARFEVVQVLRVPMGVGVAYYSYLFHCLR